MALTLPTDGFGIYDSINPTSPSAYQPRLQQIASGGFKLVLNYNLLFGHATDMVGYINYAASVGLKVIVALNNVAIWKTNAIAATFPQMSADAGSTTDSGFTTYIVNQVKGLAGTWGYYVGDEVVNADHAALLNHANFVKSADATHPRLIIEGGNGTNAVATGTNIFQDCCEVLGDDYYPLGTAPGTFTRTTAQQATGIQNFCAANGVSSAMALQAHSLSAYTPFPSVLRAPWPTEAQMIQSRSDALSNMKARLILWYSYFDVINAGSPDFAPALQWTFLVDAMQGKSSMVLFPAMKRRGTRP